VARELDVLVLGATGFTGRLVAAELAVRAHGTRLSWGIAGRDPVRLQQLAEELPGDPATVVVDVERPASVVAAAARTRVLATTVGPFARLGVEVARACAGAGTHYADITGEAGFVRSLERDIDPIARANGATMVVCCGFDAVPHDLGVQLAVSALPDDADVAVRGYVRARGRMSGGTARTLIATLTEGSGGHSTEHRSEHRDEVRPTALLRDGIHRPDRLGGWAVPMPTVDPLIVLRSARRLPGYGATFSYGHYAHVRRATTLALGGAGLGLALATARAPGGRRVLERVLPDPGEGPDAATRAASRFTVLLVGHGGGAGVIARVQGGDPGYGETARMLAEAALTLASDERPDAVGVVTPAIGLGVPYRRRLEASGMRFELLETIP
jgi:short subunit dehydrogenase-like uncharacterized protein